MSQFGEFNPGPAAYSGGIRVEYLQHDGSAALGVARVGTPSHAVPATMLRDGRPVTGFDAALEKGLLDNYMPGQVQQAPGNTGVRGRLASTSLIGARTAARNAAGTPGVAPVSEVPLAPTPVAEVQQSVDPTLSVLPGQSRLHARKIAAIVATASTTSTTSPRVLRRVPGEFAYRDDSPRTVQTTYAKPATIRAVAKVPVTASPFGSSARREAAGTGPGRRAEAGQHRKRSSRLLSRLGDLANSAYVSLFGTRD